MSFITFTLNETFCQHNMKIVRLKKNTKKGHKMQRRHPAVLDEKNMYV